MYRSPPSLTSVHRLALKEKTLNFRTYKQGWMPAKNNLFSRMFKTSGAYLCLGEKNWRGSGDGRRNAVISSIRSDRWVFIYGPYLQNKTLWLIDKRGMGIEIGKRVSLRIFFWGEGGVCTQARMMKKKSPSDLSRWCQNWVEKVIRKNWSFPYEMDVCHLRR